MSDNDFNSKNNNNGFNLNRKSKISISDNLNELSDSELYYRKILLSENKRISFQNNYRQVNSANDNIKSD